MTWNGYLFPQNPPSRRNKTRILTARYLTVLKPRVSNSRGVGPGMHKCPALGIENPIKCPGVARGGWIQVELTDEYKRTCSFLSMWDCFISQSSGVLISSKWHFFFCSFLFTPLWPCEISRKKVSPRQLCAPLFFHSTQIQTPTKNKIFLSNPIFGTLWFQSLIKPNTVVSVAADENFMQASRNLPNNNRTPSNGGKQRGKHLLIARCS